MPDAGAHRADVKNSMSPSVSAGSARRVMTIVIAARMTSTAPAAASAVQRNTVSPVPPRARRSIGGFTIADALPLDLGELCQGLVLDRLRQRREVDLGEQGLPVGEEELEVGLHRRALRLVGRP